MKAWIAPFLCAVLPFTSLYGALAQNARVTVDATRVENHVSPRMYAAFVEMMAEDVKWGLTPEMVHDRSFEENADYFGLPAGWQLEPDTRNDNVGAIRFEPTTDDAYPRKSMATGALEHSLRITLAPGDITDTRRGLSQGRISVQAGITYSGYFWARCAAKQGYAGPVIVALEEDNTDGAQYARTAMADVSDTEWHQYRFTLVPSKTDRFAKLTLLFGGKGVLLLDQVSLEPAEAMREVRPDVEAMIRGLRPSFLRWPGGNVAQDYHWQWGIGPRDQRPVWINKAWSGAPEPDDLGTDEYLALCERLYIEPSITVNVDGAGATPEEAAAWVEYVNGPASSKYGAMRAANGHPAPYDVKQWELGNEIFGDWVRGHVTAQQYAERAVVYAKALHAVDPSLRLIAVGEGIYPGSDTWNSTVLRIAGPHIKYLAVHDYTTRSQNAKEPNSRDAMMARAGEFERNYRHLGELVRQYAAGEDIHLIVNEWNLFYDADTIESMEGAVYAARAMNGFERDGDIVEANCISDLLNGWVGGVIQASRDRVYGTAQYYALKLWSDHLGTDRMHVDVVSPDLAAPEASAVDAIATRSPDGNTLYVKLSNAAMQAMQTAVSVRGFQDDGTVQVQMLHSADVHARNTFAAPARVRPELHTMRCHQACTLQLPADSVAVLTFRTSRTRGRQDTASR